MKESLWTVIALGSIGVAAALAFTRFAAEYFARRYLEWKRWKKAVRKEISELCERVEDGVP